MQLVTFDVTMTEHVARALQQTCERGANLFGFTEYDNKCEFFGGGAPLPVCLPPLPKPTTARFGHASNNPLCRTPPSYLHASAPEYYMYHVCSFCMFAVLQQAVIEQFAHWSAPMNAFGTIYRPLGSLNNVQCFSNRQQAICIDSQHIHQ